MDMSICPWKYGKQWVYSITYDEALSDLHQFAIPLHEELGTPGHVEVVVSQIGITRNIGNSTFNGLRHMNADELNDLIARGWGIGNHSWSHQTIPPEKVDMEIGQAKKELESCIDQPVILYCAPGDNRNMAPHVLDACRKFGYLGAMSITDAINIPGEELFWINRTALHDHYYPPFFSAFDPYRNINLARSRSGWLIDYCHCPIEEPLHPSKDCSASQLRERFEVVLSEGGDDVWWAVPEEVLSYHLMRRHARIESVATSPGIQHYRVHLDRLPHGVPYQALTLDTRVPAAWCRAPSVVVDRNRQSASVVRPGILRITTELKDESDIIFGPAAV